MAYYPSAIKNDFVTKIDFSDTILAAHINDLQGEVTAIESTLGTSISTGSGWIGAFDKLTTNWGTLKARLNNIEYGINTLFSETLPAGGTTGQVLTKTSGTDYDFSWATVNALPSFSGNAGKYLTNNGTAASWSSIIGLPSLTGTSGQYLTSDGTNPSWATITGLPSVTGNSGKYLTNNGSTASWASVESTVSPLLLIGA